MHRSDTDMEASEDVTVVTFLYLLLHSLIQTLTEQHYSAAA